MATYGNEQQQPMVNVAAKLISPECLELLQFRINEEEKSARLYESMSLYLQNVGYENASKVWATYGTEELKHAGWAKDYLLSLGISPQLRPIPTMSCEYMGLPDVIRKSYEHEILVTEQCKALAGAAMKCNDFMLFQLAQKYLSEQIEELDKVQTLMDKLKTFGTDTISLRLFEAELGE